MRRRLCNKMPALRIRSAPYGKTYTDWATTWWKWVVETPASASAIFGKGDCRSNQAGNVWFLWGDFAGKNKVTRKCNLPADTALFFPLINYSYFSFPSDPANTRTKPFVLSRVACTPAQLSASIDGMPVAMPTQYFVPPHLFDVTLPADNVFGFPGGTVFSPNSDAGYYLFLNPLSPGERNIQWSASWTCPQPDSGNTYQQNVTYVITVK